jgi:ATP-dependent protease HslVU (ClpYQ) peptidase subunit
MTCIVGLVEKDAVYIGGDSAGVGGLDITVRAQSKVFQNGPFLMGYTSSFRMGQLLQYAFDPPVRTVSQDVYGYMVTTFADAVRECLKGGGYARKDNDVEAGGTFLVAYEGRLFTIEDDYQVYETADGFNAVGCGADYALGSMHVTGYMNPEGRIRMALETSAHFSAGVRGPFTVLKVAA